MEQDIQKDKKLYTTHVIDNRQIAPGVFVLSYPRVHHFKAGQCIGLTTDQEVSPRLYSIASGEKEMVVQILYNVKDDGWLTPRLSEVKAGNELHVTAPQGIFCDNETPAWWIASGTGIAPFSSMFRSGLSQNKTIIHGGRYRNSFYFEKEFKTGLKDAYIRCCSQESGPGIYPGRLTQYLKEIPELPSQYRYFLCGSPEMVVDVRDLLIAKGIAFENIVAEIYF
ncbi:MAG: ferredoxin--NADP reductase [Marinifilaceae bacterium]|jgi:ferredoxin--NADP+ reductase